MQDMRNGAGVGRGVVEDVLGRAYRSRSRRGPWRPLCGARGERRVCEETDSSGEAASAAGEELDVGGWWYGSMEAVISALAFLVAGRAGRRRRLGVRELVHRIAAAPLP